MFRSATFKLTLYYIGLVVAISVIFSAILYQVASHQLATGIMRESNRIYTQFPVFDNDGILRPRTDIVTDQHRLLAHLVIFNIIVVVIAGFGSYLLARRTLTPIEEAHEQQKRFTSDVSHELRTPLTALKMEAEVALMNPDSTATELRETIKSNLEEASKLESIINSILRLTRLEADELRQQFSEVSAQAVAEAAIDDVSKKAETRDITIKHIEKTDSTLLGDSMSVQQLLVILLDNAIKYSHSGTTITLETKSTNNEVQFSIKDQGVGIDPASLEHVFDRFYRADDSRTRSSAGGYGLGLSIAKMIADIHSGNITLTSAPDQGTTALASFQKYYPRKSKTNHSSQRIYQEMK